MVLDFVGVPRHTPSPTHKRPHICGQLPDSETAFQFRADSYRYLNLSLSSKPPPKVLLFLRQDRCVRMCVRMFAACVYESCCWLSVGVEILQHVPRRRCARLACTL